MVSKRRQRELARQRHVRRQQQLVERRARQRRRNSIVAIVMVGLILIGTGTWAVVAYAFGGNDNTSTLAVATPTPTPTAAAAAPTKCAAIKPNPPKKGQPTVPNVTGAAPTKLGIKDVKKGTGAIAKTGSSLSVTYIGISCSTGTVFDASYLHGGTPFTVTPLGTAQVITGWNQGLLGVRAGGVRELVIPPALGYGAQGQGSIKANEVLIFLITVKSVK